MTSTENYNWQKELLNNVTTAKELFDRGLIDENQVEDLQKIIDRYPMSITNYYLGLIKNKDYSDPVYKMSIASLLEFSEEGRQDTSGEAENTVADGIQHKYDNTVLLLSTNVCAMYCRHCFRKRLVGLSEEEILSFTDKAIEYIRSHPEVDNVLITGGDALMNTNKVIGRYLSKLTEIEHIKFIRFGSRAPVVFPDRIIKDGELIEIFTKYSNKKTVYLVTQFNHPVELTKEAVKATDMLRKAGVPVLNQTVLLNGVNSNADTLTELFNGLVSNGITPYYLFQCRPVKGVKGLFSVPLLEAIKIVDDTRSRLSGLAKRFKFSMSHIKGKIEIIGSTRKNRLILQQHQAKNNDDLNKLFYVKVRKNSRWLPDELNYKLI
ncbi:MAG: KamA family radical SAM protein [Christensenellales bacterium]